MRWNELRDALISATLTFVVAFSISYGTALMNNVDWKVALIPAFGFALANFGSSLMALKGVRVFRTIPPTKKCWKNGVNHALYKVCKVC